MVSNSSTPGGSTIKLKAKRYSRRTAKEFRKFVVLVMGLTIILIGILLLVLPGPGVITIAFGLTVLASEFYWAKSWLKKFEHRIDSVKNKITSSKKQE